MYGVDFHRRGRIAEEKLSVLLQAKTGEPFEHDGRHIHVTPRPLTPGGPSLAQAVSFGIKPQGDEWLSIVRCPPEARGAADAWGDVGNALPLMRRVKKQFDPTGALNPGRFVGGI